MRSAAIAALSRQLQGLMGARQAWANGMADEWRDAVFDRFERDSLNELDRLDRHLAQALQELQDEYSRAERLR